MIFAEQAVASAYLILDLDTKFTKKFRETLASDGLEILRVGPRKPNLNAFAERIVQSIRVELLDQFVCFGIEHLRYIVKRYEAYYDRLRPHQGRNNQTLPVAAGDEPATIPLSCGPVECQEDLGGLLRRYFHRAARVKIVFRRDES